MILKLFINFHKIYRSFNNKNYFIMLLSLVFINNIKNANAIFIII